MPATSRPADSRQLTAEMRKTGRHAGQHVAVGTLWEKTGSGSSCYWPTCRECASENAFCIWPAANAELSTMVAVVASGVCPHPSITSCTATTCKRCLDMHGRLG